jgi:hypothetical protein
LVKLGHGAGWIVPFVKSVATINDPRSTDADKGEAIVWMLVDAATLGAGVIVRDGAKLTRMGEGAAKQGAKTAAEKGATRVVSSISSSPKLVREAEAAGRTAQRSIDHLTSELARGNLNPGIGSKSLGFGISYARARDGARVFFRQGSDGVIEILGKATKNNEQSVINEVLRVFGK